MYRKKSNFIVILVFCLILNSCKTTEKTESLEGSGTGTIQDLYNSASSAVITDNQGQEKKKVRDIWDTYPELPDYTGMDEYPGIYCSIFDRVFLKEDWDLLYGNASYITLRNKAEKTASYTLGHISDTNPLDDSDYSVFSYIYPLTELCYMKDGTPQQLQNYYCEVLSIQDDQINGNPAQGFRFESVSKFNYIPKYSYMVFQRIDDDIIYETMVTDNVYTEDGTRKQGEPKEKIVLDTRTNMDGTRLIDLTEEAPEIEYKVYHGDVNMAVPSFMTIEEAGNGFRIREREGEYTPFNHAGASVMYLTEEITTKQQVETLISEMNYLANNKETLKCSSLQYEENIRFLGVDTATHLYGNLFIKEGGLDVRKDFCGTGKIRFDIFYLQRDEKKLLVMFYRGEDQNDKFWDFIMYNCY